MAIDHVRTIIRENVAEESLEHFEKQCTVVDELSDTLKKEEDPDKAYTVAVAWATSILSLARMESALLSAVLPEFVLDLKKISEQGAALNKRKREAENLVYNLRGGSPSTVQPLSMERDLVMAEKREKATKRRNEIFAEVREGWEELGPEQNSLSMSIGQIKLMLRALRAFTENRFPQPTRKARNPMARLSFDSGADPIAAFAERYVDGMDGRGSAEAKAALEQDQKIERQAAVLKQLRRQTVAAHG